MPDSALVKKLKIKAGQRVGFINAPQGYLDELGALPEGVQTAEKLDGEFDWLQVFVLRRAELEALIPQVISALKPDSLLWISFPKGISKIQTDLTRDTGWDVLQGVDLKWINLVSVNETWSAFSLRPYKPGEKKQSFR